MNKYFTDTLILLIFTINILLLVFLSEVNPLLALSNKLISIGGLLWLINFYYKTLKFENVTGNNKRAEAKIAGITPAELIFKGKWDDSPPNILLPICLLG